MLAEVARQSLRPPGLWGQLAEKNRRLREQSRLLFNELWRQVCLSEVAGFQARFNVSIVREERAFRQSAKCPPLPPSQAPPRFSEMQRVSLGHDFAPESWLCGIVVGHRWRETGLSEHGAPCLAGWSYEVQFGDPDGLFTIWIGEECLHPDTRNPYCRSLRRE